MNHYKKGKNVEEELSKDKIPIPNLPKDFLWMHVKGGTKVSNVVDYAKNSLNTKEHRTVVWSGSGGGVTKTISCAEILKRDLPLHQITRLCYQKIEEYWEPTTKGLDEIVATRQIPCIHILLSLDDTYKNTAGYQFSKTGTTFWIETTATSSDDSHRTHRKNRQSNQFFSKSKINSTNENDFNKIHINNGNSKINKPKIVDNISSNEGAIRKSTNKSPIDAYPPTTRVASPNIQIPSNKKSFKQRAYNSFHDEINSSDHVNKNTENNSKNADQILTSPSDPFRKTFKNQRYSDSEIHLPSGSSRKPYRNNVDSKRYSLNLSADMSTVKVKNKLLNLADGEINKVEIEKKCDKINESEQSKE